MLTLRTLSLGAAISALATLAACSDAPIAPTSALLPAVGPATAAGVTPTTPAGAANVPQLQEVKVVVLVYDPLASYVSAKVAFTGGATTKTVIDNGSSDLDARVGYVAVKMPKVAHYSATVVSAPIQYSLYGATSTQEQWWAPDQVALGRIDLHVAPHLTITTLKDGQTYLGQTIKVTNASGFGAVITDGGAGDLYANGAGSLVDGKIQVQVPELGTYTVCPQSPLASTVQAACVTVGAAAWGGVYQATLAYKTILFLP